MGKDSGKADQMRQMRERAFVAKRTVPEAEPEDEVPGRGESVAPEKEERLRRAWPPGKPTKGAKGGRPKAERTRSEVLQVPLYPEEMASVIGRAGAGAVAVAKWARGVLLRELGLPE